MNFQGVVSKQARSEEWLKCIEEVLAGRFYRGPFFTRFHADQLADPLAPEKLLTRRQQDVLSLIGQTQSDGEIATKLGIGPETVRHVRTILAKKLDRPSTAELIKFSQDTGYAAFASEPRKRRKARGPGRRKPGSTA